MNEQLSQTDLLKAVLLSFKIQTYDFQEIQGTSVTLYKFRPQIGVRINRIRAIKDELASAIGVPNVRIIAPMYDGSVGIEIPVREKTILQLSEILNSPEYMTTAMTLPLAIGRTVTGSVFMADLALMPHLLVAGATGQGKSVGLNCMLMSLLHKRTPEELKLVLIDPKKVELSVYERIARPYLARYEDMPAIITETDHARIMLDVLCRLMDKRYGMLSERNVRSIAEYNKCAEKKMEYYVVVIDEYGDLTLSDGYGRDMERYICRLAQKARAVGIHLIISTQRPDTKIVTGSIKANFPTRIAFRTTTGTDSRVILDQIGAERLTGNGDMLYFSGAEITRCQCAYASTQEVTDACQRIANTYPDHRPKVLRFPKPEPQQQPQTMFDWICSMMPKSPTSGESVFSPFGFYSAEILRNSRHTS